MRNARVWLTITVVVILGAIGRAQSPSGAYNSPALGGIPGGSSGQFQFNNSGAFAGSSVVTTVSGGAPSLAVAGVNGTGPTMTVTSPGSGQATVLQLTGAAGNNLPVLSVLSGGSASSPGVQSFAYSTGTNCSSSASPAVCGSAAAGSFVLAAAATTVTVNTTAVTANSQIIVVNDDSLGTKLSVTCNTALDQVFVSGRVAATSFTITGTAPVTNPNCYSYWIVN